MKRAFKKIIIIVLLFVISFFCVRHWFTIQSENLWASTKESLISKGVSFNLKDIIPPKVLDRENFALADFFGAENQEFLKKPSFKNDAQKLVFEYDNLPNFIDLKIIQQSFRDEGLDIWNQPEVQGEASDDVSKAIEKYADDILLLEQTIQERPQYNCNLNYGSDGLVIKAWIEHTGSLRVQMNAQWWLVLRSYVLLEQGKSALALRDIKNALFLAECLKDDPRIISQLCRSRMLQAVIFPIWQGIAKLQWNEKELQELEGVFSDINLLPGISRAIDFERHNLNHIHDRLRQLVQKDNREYQASLISFGVPLNAFKSLSRFYVSPDAFIDRSQVHSNKFYHEYLFDLIDLKTGRIFYDKIANLDQYFEGDKDNPFNLILAITMPSFSSAVKSVGTVQVMIHHAQMACAIELYKLDKGYYPEKIDYLEKEFPNDTFGGSSYEYIKVKTGRYHLTGKGLSESVEKEKDKTNKSAGGLVWKY